MFEKIHELVEAHEAKRAATDYGPPLTDEEIASAVEQYERFASKEGAIKVYMADVHRYIATMLEVTRLRKLVNPVLVVLKEKT
jgi:broad specificity phosphatase PhoE